MSDLARRPGPSPLPDTETTDERADRAEALRLTQRALHVEVNPWDLPCLAHWVHTGRELMHTDHSSPDAARWRPGDDQ